jgi:hypothetical protein
VPTVTELGGQPGVDLVAVVMVVEQHPNLADAVDVPQRVLASEAIR